MPIASHKKILRSFTKMRWKEYIQDADETMKLPELSVIPGRSASTRIDTFHKTLVGGSKDAHHVKVITKNDSHAAFVWQTSPEKLKEAVRWGVVHAESITGKVMGALGQYRVAAHELIIKGMISNTHATKIGLLDLYQDRIEKLEKLESLVNQKNSAKDLIAALEFYIVEMSTIKDNVAIFYLGSSDIHGLAPNAISQIHGDIDDDIKRAVEFIQKIKNNNIYLDEINRGRGYHSILEFVKTQMMYNLYEFQGINQDISYSLNRTTAFTRGRLNDFIEDARKEINDHHPDQRNMVGKKHHGQFDQTEKVIYDFSHAHLTPEKERKAMMAVSFIEGWDKVEWTAPGKAKVVNRYGQAELKEIAATRWQVTRNFGAFLRKVGVTLVNMAKSLFVQTKPWIADTWHDEKNPDFRLVTDDLFDKSRMNKPVWYTPWTMLKKIATSLVDIFHGIYDAGKSIFNIPEQFWFDWYSTTELPLLEDLQKNVMDEICFMVTTEEEIKTELLQHVVDVNNRKETEEDKKINLNTFMQKDNESDLSGVAIANQDYHLTAGETNDILNSAVRGLTEFSEFFTHEIFAKNPVAGALFLTAYGLGGAAILAPSYVAFLGPKFLAIEQAIGYTLGGSQFSAAIAAGSISGQVVSMVVDGVQHGPGSTLGNVLSAFTQNPTELAVIVSFAWATGYLLAETGIPIIGDILHEEVNGSSLNYIILGAKTALISQALFHKQQQYKFVNSPFEFNGNEILAKNKALYEAHKEFIERFKFIKWLSDNQSHLPKLSAESRCHLERYIDKMFTKKNEADALRKLIRKEKVRSIAYQLLAVPLNYIPAILRVIVSLFVGMVAAIYRQPHPVQPIINALSALYNQVHKDLSRLVIFAAELTRWVVSVVTSLIKMTVFLVSMAASRLGAVLDMQSGHAMHRFFAHAHVGLRKLGEIFYPNDISRDIVSAHPKSTVMQYQTSYGLLMDKAFNKAHRDGEEVECLLVTEDAKKVETNAQPAVQPNTPEDPIQVAGLAFNH